MISITNGASFFGWRRPMPPALAAARGPCRRSARGFGCAGCSSSTSACLHPGEQIREGGARSLGHIVIQRIPQDQLNCRLVAGQAQLFRLFRCDQHVHHLDRDRLAFGIFLDSPGRRRALPDSAAASSSPCPDSLPPPGLLPEIRTSTRMPGTTKPATPTTSLTRIATARIPGGIIAARPPPAPFGARRESMIGSLAKIGVITPRPTTS